MKILNRLFFTSWRCHGAGQSACGFQVQTRAELPPEMQRTRLEVQSIPDSEFARRLEVHLEQNGVEVVITALKVMPLSSRFRLTASRKEIQSIGDNARVREFLVRHTVQFRLLDSEGTGDDSACRHLNKVVSTNFNEQDILGCQSGKMSS